MASTFDRIPLNRTRHLAVAALEDAGLSREWVIVAPDDDDDLDDADEGEDGDDEDDDEEDEGGEDPPGWSD